MKRNIATISLNATTLGGYSINNVMKRVVIDYMTDIDLNNLTEDCTIYSFLNDINQNVGKYTFNNFPFDLTTGGFDVIVLRHGRSYHTQIFIAYNRSDLWIRSTVSQGDNPVWFGWQKISGTNSLNQAIKDYLDKNGYMPAAS